MIKTKKTHTYFNHGLRFSLLLHFTFLLWLLAFWAVDSLRGPTDAEKRLLLNKQSIRVDVVDLPSLKLQDLYKVDLSKEAETEAGKINQTKNQKIKEEKQA